MPRIEKDLRTVIHVRMPALLVKKIDHIAVEIETDRARALQAIVESAIATEQWASLLPSAVRDA